MNRPNSIAYINQRIIIMNFHADCIEFKTRAIFNEQTWQHSAIVYPQQDAFIVLYNSQREGEDAPGTYGSEAFITQKDAMKFALHRVAVMQGQR